MQAGGDFDQHVHAGERLWASELRAEGDGAVPREGLFHDALYAGAVFAGGLYESEDADDSLVAGDQLQVRKIPGVKGHIQSEEPVCAQKRMGTNNEVSEQSPRGTCAR